MANPLATSVVLSILLTAFSGYAASPEIGFGEPTHALPIGKKEVLTQAPSLHGWNINVVDMVEAGRCTSILISGSLLYATLDATLLVIDISDPRSPRRIGYTLLSGYCSDIARKDDHLYCRLAVAKRVEIVDVSDPAVPEVVGGFASSYDYQLTVDGNYLYVDYNDGFRVYNIAVPTNPTLVGSIATGMGIDMVVRDGHLFTALYSVGLRIFDVTIPQSPTILSTLPIAFGCSGIDVEGTYAFLISSGGGLYIVDVTNPSAPLEVGFAPGSAFYDVQTEQEYAYVVDHDDATLEIFDVSDPSSPTLASSTTLCYFYPTDIAVSGDVAAFGGGAPGICVMDVSERAEPAPYSSYDVLPPIHDLDVAPAHLAFPADMAGLVMMNRYDTSQRHYVSGDEYSFDGYEVIVRDNLAYVGSCGPYGQPGTLGVFDISEPASPTKVGSLSLPHCLGRLGLGDSHIFATISGALLSIDVSNPAAPHIVSEMPLVGGAGLGFDVEEPYIYLAKSNSGLRVIDVSNPAAPFVVGPDLPLGTGDARGVAITNDHAFITMESTPISGLRIVDISNPLQPVLVGRYDTGDHGPATTVSAQDQYVYFSTDAYLRVLDVSVPATPVEVANIAIGGLEGKLIIAPPFIYGTPYVDGGYSPLLKFQTDYMTAVTKKQNFDLLLRQNYPNPFNPATMIQFELPSSARATIEIFDVRGVRVRKLLDELVSPGIHSAEWNGQDDRGRSVPSGVYFYRLEAGGRMQTKKLMVLK